VPVHSPARDEEPARDLAIGQPLRHELGNLVSPSRELFCYTHAAILGWANLTWGRGWDLNLGWACTHNSFQDESDVFSRYVVHTVPHFADAVPRH
jgi:hypothetical protein